MLFPRNFSLILFVGYKDKIVSFASVYAHLCSKHPSPPPGLEGAGGECGGDQKWGHHQEEQDLNSGT